MLIITGHAFADTTWVSGAVSGEWTRDGNPYIVVDSTWVPEGERLTLTAGVEAFFDEGQGLYVFGTMNAEGSERDSVRIRVSEGVEHWRGLRLYGRNRTAWSYSSVICPDTAFILDPNCTFTLNNSLVATKSPISGVTAYGIIGGFLNIIDSVMRSKSHHMASGGSLIATHSVLDFGEHEDNQPGFWSSGTAYRFTGCEVTGSLSENEGSSIIDSCRWLRTRFGRNGGSVAVAATGAQARMIETYVEGGAGIGSVDGSPALFRNNIVLGGANFNSCSPNIIGCTIGDLTDILDCGVATVKNTTIHGAIWVRGTTQQVTIDSCSLTPTEGEYHFLSCGEGKIAVRRSFLNVGIHRSRLDSGYFDHNTIVFDSINNRGIDGSHNVLWTNNIFVATVPMVRLFNDGDNIAPGILYNNIWGFDIAAGYDDNLFLLEDLDSSNVIADPFIDWNDGSPKLSPRSPCIDRGDPNAPLDPDSTRSDIGAYFRDQSNIVSFIGLDSPDFNSRLIAFPNPFNNSTLIKYSTVPINREATKLAIYDLSGRMVAELLSSETLNLRAGGGGKSVGYGDPTVGRVVWDASNQPAGLYIVRLETNGQHISKKIMLIK